MTASGDAREEIQNVTFSPKGKLFQPLAIAWHIFTNCQCGNAGENLVGQTRKFDSGLTRAAPPLGMTALQNLNEVVRGPCDYLPHSESVVVLGSRRPKILKLKLVLLRWKYLTCKVFFLAGDRGSGLNM